MKSSEGVMQKDVFLVSVCCISLEMVIPSTKYRFSAIRKLTIKKVSIIDVIFRCKKKKVGMGRNVAHLMYSYTFVSWVI